MNVDQFPLAPIVALWIVIVTLAIVTNQAYQRLDRRLQPRRPTLEPNLPDPVAQYLVRLGAKLDLPDGMTAEVIEEVRDHIADSTTGLLAEGLELEAAVREALARLGSPVELGRQLTRSQQTRRRSLLGATGGILAVPGALEIGLLAGTFFLFPATYLAGRGPMMLAGLSSDPFMGEVLAPVALVPGYAAGCCLGGRMGVRIWAAVGRRKPERLGAAWALLGTPLIAAWMLFVWSRTQSWALVIAEMLVPAAFAFGALYRVGAGRIWSASLKQLAAFAGLLLLFGCFSGSILLASYGAQVEPYSPTPTQVVQNIDRAGPAPASALVRGSCGFATPEHTVFCSFDPPAGSWRDLRLEAWRGLKGHLAWAGGIVSTAWSPTLIAPGRFVDRTPFGLLRQQVAAVLNLGMRRDGPFWWVVLTGLGPDGRRYRLTDGELAEIPFNGTAWEWLTAPG